MELSCAFVLFIVVGFVTSSPYGYGTKGGVAAKADASTDAYSGAEDMLVIPVGAGGYSGSYSKSSASSYASSSASSSSFTYSGAGAIPGSAGGIPGGSGCGSDACQSGNKGPNSAASTGSQAISGAKAGASNNLDKKVAGTNYNANNVNSGSLNYDGKSDCVSGNCQAAGENPLGSLNGYSSANSKANAATTAQADLSGQHSKDSPTTTDCSGYNCPSSSASGDDKNDIPKAQPDEEGCKSGNCEQYSYPQNQNIAKCGSGKCGTSDNESDDIQVSKNNNVSPGSCAYGNCGPSGYGALPQTLTPNQGPPAKCNTPECNGVPSSGPSGSGQYKPATYLITPKEDKDGCFAPNCQNGLPVNNDYYSTLTLPSDKSPSCAGGNCFSNYKSPSKTPIGPVIPGYGSHTLNLEATKCTSPNCVGGNHQVNGPINVYLQNNCAGGKCDTPAKTDLAYNTPSVNLPKPDYGSIYFPDSSNCAPGSTNCGQKPTFGISPSYNTRQESGISVPSYNKPSLILQTTAPVTGFGSNYAGNSLSSSQAGSNSGSYGPTGPANCAPGTPNCGPKPTTTGFASPSYNNPQVSVLPSAFAPSVPASYNKPAPVPQPAAPATELGTNCAPGTPNCGPKPSYNTPQVVGLPSAFGPSIPASSYNKPTIIPQPGIPTTGFGSNYGNSLSSSQAGSNAGSYGSTGSQNGYGASAFQQPSTDIKPGYGGSGSYNSNPGYGSVSPGFPSYPSASPRPVSSPSGTPSYGITAPQLNVPTPSKCNTAGSGCSAPVIPGSIAPAPPVKPIAAGTPNKEVPYTGGFGAPPGLLKPNEYAISKPGHSNPNTAIDLMKPTCASGSCGQPSVSPVAPSSGSSSPSHEHSGSNAGAQATAVASANAVAYTGGFGGPPGFLKPYDNGKVDLPVSAASQPSVSQSGVHHSATYGSPHNEGGYGGGNSNQANSAAVANAAASSTAGSGVASNGGCGGGCGGYGGQRSSGYNGGYGHSGGRALTDDALAGASAKSQASAVSSAGGYGEKGGYASSSATAQATAGAAVKGSYGRR